MLQPHNAVHGPSHQDQTTRLCASRRVHDMDQSAPAGPTVVAGARVRVGPGATRGVSVGASVPAPAEVSVGAGAGASVADPAHAGDAVETGTTAGAQAVAYPGAEARMLTDPPERR